MKSVFKAIYEVLKSIGEARAAAALARSGNYQAAQAIYKN